MKPLLLVADGDSDLCDIYQQVLAQRHYDVETANNGLECIEKLRRLKPAVLVLDWELRWGGGPGVLAWLREQSSLAGVAVVLTTTAGCVQGDAEQIEPPVTQLLSKPFTLAALLASVQTAVAQSTQKRCYTLNCATVQP